ncbi:Cytosine deaminase [Candidatus Ornithobacterium hominis]|uniref:amidohydrolase family protein n=1 Tax=Candidatus Ornithobacterium hominis TaxID=2497989 RepID=UPI000E5C1F9B|nr:amidohydrolase family protein [Candidatus Ornithobacterium hominis]SZD73798.1 Cytosine deaminase [Candidatus Ornithobacterium hominis]
MSKLEHFDPKNAVIEKIIEKGGWVNCHAHLDRAYSLQKDTFSFTNSYLKEKWHLVDEMKKNSSVDIIYDRMARAIEYFIEQGAQAVGSFIDVDEVMQDRSIKAAQKIKEKFGNDIEIRFANQVLKGVIDPKAKEWFDLSSDFVDIIGGLPAKDFGQEEEHLDILMETAKSKGKLVHVHVDQFNTDEEKETELLARKTIEHGMQNKVTAVHSISVAAHPKKYRYELYDLMNEAQLHVISCPTAWIDHNRTERLAPSHNSVTPVDEMVPHGITVAFGTDNINDIYKPFSDGDLWTELRVMLESCHYYDVDKLSDIATVNGLKVLGINK